MMGDLIHSCPDGIENNFNFCPFCGESLTEEKKEKTLEDRIHIVPNKIEIHRAHDILSIIIDDDDDEHILMSEKNKIAMEASLQVLCWILGHKRGDDFIENIVATEAELAGKGIVFTYKEEGEE